MSDARAKAEARRAKILARENKIVSAVSDVTTSAISSTSSITSSTSNEIKSPEEIKSKERPLAYRRKFVSSLPSKSESTESTLVKPVADDRDPDDVSITDALKKSEEKKPVSVPGDSISNTTSVEKEGHSETKKKEFKYEKKTLKEIEKEIAENTAKFDEQTLKKAGNNNSSTLSNENKKNDTDSNTISQDDKSSDNKDAKKDKKNDEKEKKAIKLPQKSNWQPGSILKLIRLFIIIALGVHSAYQAVQTNQIAVASFEKSDVNNLDLLTRFQSKSSVSTQKTAQIDDLPTTDNFDISSIHYDHQNNKTWYSWARKKLINQVECSVSVVGLIWWISNLIQPFVDRVLGLKLEAKKNENIFNRLLSMYQNGLDGVYEGVYNSIGEISFHLFVVITAALIFTIAYSPESLSSLVWPNNKSILTGQTNEL